LNDQIKNLIKEQRINNKQSIEKFDLFKDSIFREIDASSKTIYWLLGVLIPMFIVQLISNWTGKKEEKKY